MYYNHLVLMLRNYNTGWLPYVDRLHIQYDDLVYQYAHIILYKERKRLGILNLFANPFYPVTETYKFIDKQEQDMQMTQKANDVTNTRVNIEEDLL